MPAALRPKVAALSAPAALEKRLSEAIDRTVTTEAMAFRVPSSAVWSVIGVGQYVVTALLIFAALWFVSLFVLDRPATGSIDLPILGPVPSPVILLAAVLLAGYLLAMALRLHAGWRGRRWARRVGTLITNELNTRIRDAILLPLDELGQQAPTSHHVVELEPGRGRFGRHLGGLRLHLDRIAIACKLPGRLGRSPWLPA